MGSRTAQEFFLAVMLALTAISFGRPSPAAESLPLAGVWRFALDRDDAGIRESWFAKDLAGRIDLPGTLPAQGIGDEVTAATKWCGTILDKSYYSAPEYAPYRRLGNFKIPFWLQPDKYYVGAAWFQRDVEIPLAWHGRRVALTLERPHWETRVWLDGRLVGTNNSLSTPHEYSLGAGVTPGRHRLTVRVDNRMVVDVGCDSCSVSDHTQGNWNGIVGRINLSATTPVWIDDAQVYPNVADRSARIRVWVGNATGRSGAGTLAAGDQRVPIAWDGKGGTGDLTVKLGPRAELWDEFHPALQRLIVRIRGESAEDQREVVFGLREISTQRTQFVLNGRKLFIRATCECGVFPKTGHPPTDVESWRRVIRICREHGLNCLRFHCFCPPEAAFAAADESGMYFIIDCATWPNTSTSLGDGQPVDRWAYEETDRVLKAYGNHPSAILMLLGCEPGGAKSSLFLRQWLDHYQAHDPRRLFSSMSGWPELVESQWHLMADPRVFLWGAGIGARINARPPETITDYRGAINCRRAPVISNEIGEWCAYPNFAEIPKYTGYLKPKNFEIFHDFLVAHHLGDQAQQFLMASGKLQTICYKEDIESALRTPGMGGFLLLDLHDFPGQGTALVGVLDAFWESKGYVAADEYRRFCNATVPLARLKKRVFTVGETLEADLEVAHFGAAPIIGAVTRWKLVADDGQSKAWGELPPKTVPVDNGIALGRVSIDLREAPAPARYKLVVNIAESSRPLAENDWDVWVYPPKADTAVPAGVTVAQAWNESVRAALEAGGKVLVIAPRGVRNDATKPVKLGFSSIFWNTAWTGRTAPTTLGILCDPKHPALAHFPTEYHSNWQWWYLVHRATPMILDDMPAELRPIVAVIDDWFTAQGRFGFRGQGRPGQIDRFEHQFDRRS